MNHFTYLIFLLTFNFTIAQDLSKPQYYFDVEGNAIRKADYLQKAKDSLYTYIPHIIENDTAIIGSLNRREEKGIMRQNDRLQLIKNIESVTGQKVDINKTLIINFYFNNDLNPGNLCIDNYTSDRKYKRELKQNNDSIKQFFFTESGYDYSKDFVYMDKNKFIENLIFSVEFGCGNYIIIKPNGHFLRRLGEYRQDEIIDKAKEDW